MSLPLYMDVHIPRAITEGLRLRGVDVLTHWYERAEISQEKAAQIAGLERASFIDALARLGCETFRVDPEDLKREFRLG